MIKPVSLLLLAAVLCGSCGSRTGRTAATSCDEPSARPSEYVSTLVGTHSDFTLSTGNTYPAVALPWGMNFWTPQTGEMGSGWAYTYGAHTIRGLKQTHQPSPWINDYGQFSIMPVRGRDKVDEESRQSWFSHQSEEARPYYYSVYLADHDIKAEIAPTERAAIMRFTFPESDESGVVIDAFDRGSYIRVMHDKRTVVGYTTRNSGGVPDNFKNWFIVRFDRKIRDFQIYCRSCRRSRLRSTRRARLWGKTAGFWYVPPVQRLWCALWSKERTAIRSILWQKGCQSDRVCRIIRKSQHKVDVVFASTLFCEREG